MTLHPKRFAKHLAAVLPPGLRRALRRRYYLRIVRAHTESDWEWSPFIKPLVPPGSLVVDIGANVGYLSGLLARWVGPTGRVVSVEPIPATFDALSASMKTLYPDTVTTVQSCVSHREGKVTMAVPEYAEGGSNYYESRIVESEEGQTTYTVPATTLDLLLHDRNPNATPAFIKIDVEGHELAVIQGGMDVLARHHPPLLIEVAGDPDEEGSDAAELINLLGSLGYTPHGIKEDRLQPRKAGDAAVDYLFLRAGGEKQE